MNRFLVTQFTPEMLDSGSGIMLQEITKQETLGELRGGFISFVPEEPAEEVADFLGIVAPVKHNYDRETFALSPLDRVVLVSKHAKGFRCFLGTAMASRF